MWNISASYRDRSESGENLHQLRIRKASLFRRLVEPVRDKSVCDRNKDGRGPMEAKVIMQVISGLAFSGAAAAAFATIHASVAPQWRRIARLALGRPEMAFAPLAQLAQAERRIAVRRWSGATRPAEWRAAA